MDAEEGIYIKDKHKVGMGKVDWIWSLASVTLGLLRMKTLQ